MLGPSNWPQRSIGAVQGKLKNVEDDEIFFKDVAGIDDAKRELAELVDFFNFPERYGNSGARAPRGVLLFGPPGTGKTLLARAVAGEANATFFGVNASEFVEMFMGVGASRVRDLFSSARAVAPAVIFIDEIDAIGRVRGGTDGNDERDQTLNQMLVEMDGFDPRDGVVVIAATNRRDVLDSALIRAGRFDRQVPLLQDLGSSCPPGVAIGLMAALVCRCLWGCHRGSAASRCSKCTCGRSSGTRTT